VSHSVRTVDGVQTDHFFEVVQFACGAANLQPVALDDGDACGVVTTVLQALQTFQQHRDYTFISDVTNNS
jgi:hypothetical protein